MNTVHIHAPLPDILSIHSGHCPDCERRSWFAAMHTPWYGWDSCCLHCGRRWCDGEWMPLRDQSRGSLLRDNQHRWALTNFGRLITVERTRKDAIRYAEAWLGEPWSMAREKCEVRKVTITEGWT